MEYRLVLKEIGIRFGLDRVEEALLGPLRLNSGFFPHPSEVNLVIQERIATEDASQSASERRVAATNEMLENRFAGETVSMGDIYRDYLERKKAKAEAAAETKAAGQ